MTATTDTRTAGEIIALERAALDRWGKGDPGGFLELYAQYISYFDPLTAARIDGHKAMADYYRPWTGKIRVERYEMLNPKVVAAGDMALLTYNLVNYASDGGAESPRAGGIRRPCSPGAAANGGRSIRTGHSRAIRRLRR